MEIHISVRNLVEFILRSGNIDNRRSSVPDNAMQEGGRIHRMIQRRMGSEYHAEVMLKYQYVTEKYSVLIEGRADGIIIPEKVSEAIVTIDEIKGTYRDLSKMKEPVSTHLAQAMCYAFIYAEDNGLEEIAVRMTYCAIETEELRYFHFDYSRLELQSWFGDLMERYRKWADVECEWQEKRLRSIKDMTFPFPYRNGQKELVTYVYQTIYHKKKLFIEAPTGVGKTVSTVFPAIKAMGEGRGEKLFYLTAKTITRTVAEETFAILRRERGLRFKTVILTAKDKICFMDEVECNPIDCPYARGHYDRINDAVYALLTEADSFDRERLSEYARRFQVCPFELGLDMSSFADGIICDYNYVFDPHVYLRRFFAEGSKGEYLFLIDEAHNLVERGREMYSAELCKEDFLALKRSFQEEDQYIAKMLDRCNKELLALKRECEDYQVEPVITPFLQALSRLSASMERYLEDNETGPLRKELLEFYFSVTHFQMISELCDDNYVIYSRILADGRFVLKLFCVNPANNLRECMMRGRSAILFSATLLPITYYKKLLGANADDYDVYARSVFDPARQGVFIASDVTSKYSRRSDGEFYRIASYINEIVRNRHGNYLIFLPSHLFLKRVYECYRQSFWPGEEVECLIQEERMDEVERERFLERFLGAPTDWPEGANQPVNDSDDWSAIQMEITEEGQSLLGFCVTGGIFSEGIDLKNDRLIGVIIVGTGIPQIGPEREILMNYFDELGENGFDYAYRLPGINKVLQAAGRVIRTQEDIGIVALLDERFRSGVYRRMFPKEWEHIEVTEVKTIAGQVEAFWNRWLV
ncbi:MAG: ATP-dependent DNA helicase [Lachnospiraceae bacterium]|nr:ATP-dependent DNA helicase [Lachnospiraceae bacterium]